jgi:general secretion pathway protein N
MLILLTVAAFLVTLVLYAPAALLLSWSASDDNPFRAYGVHGTLARGTVSQITAHDRPVLHGLRWQLNTGRLALLRLSMDVESEGDTPIRARYTQPLFGKARLSDLNALVGANTLLAIGGQAQLPVDGRIRLALSRIDFSQGLPIHAEGTAEVNGLAWTQARDPLRLGDFTATLSTDNAGILAVLASGNGPLELTGEAHLYKDRRYDLHLRLKPRPNAEPQVQTLIRSIGAPDAQGWHHIRQQGSLQDS